MKKRLKEEKSMNKLYDIIHRSEMKKSKDSAVKNGIYYTPKRIIKYIEKQINLKRLRV